MWPASAFLAGFIGGLALLFACGPSRPTVRVGSEGKVDTDGIAQWHLQPDRDSRDQWEKYASANDIAGQQQMISRGRSFPVANGTRVLVIEIDLPGSLYVRVLDGPYQGKAGWIDYVRVKPL